MNHSVKRNATNYTGTSFAGRPAVDDHELVRRCLTLPLGDTARRDLESLLATLTPGQFGMLKRAKRDKLFRFAADQGALPRMKPPKKRTLEVHGSDHYDSRETEGTRFAERILALRPAKPPPGRRSA